MALKRERRSRCQASYLHGLLNVLAVRESRRDQNPGDWKFAVSEFQRLKERWNPAVDLFTSTWNTQIPRFVSWFYQPGGSTPFRSCGQDWMVMPCLLSTWSRWIKLRAGVYSLRPLSIKYSVIWDPNIVINNMQDSYDTSPPLLQRGQKLVTLLVLTAMLRCGEIASISLPSVKFSNGEVSFSLLNPRKAQHSVLYKPSAWRDGKMSHAIVGYNSSSQPFQ